MSILTRAVESFLDSLDLRDVALAEVSIGGSIGLIIASRGNPRVCRVVVINPYDYAKGAGWPAALGWRAFFSWQPAFLFLARP